jgi:hypothetical protein
MKESAWEKVLELYYGEDPADRQKVICTGFNMDDCFRPDQSVYPYTLDAGVESAGQLVLKLISSSLSLSNWCFDSISEGLPAGITFISDDRLFFSNEEDITLAKTLLAV